MYTVENPPKNWAQYPKSFLREAVPALNSLKDNFALAWKYLGEMGLTKALKDGACPVIENLDAFRSSKITEISYDISGHKAYDYFISVSLYSKGKFIRTIMMGTGQLRSTVKVETDEEITEVKLNTRLSGFNDVSDSKVIRLEPRQGELGLGE